jgi:hypothetical protein
MSDASAAEFTVYQTEGKEAAIAEILNLEGFAVDYGYSSPIEIANVVSGAIFVNDTARIGSLTSIGQALEELAIPYLATQDSKAPYDAELRVYTPELGSNTVTGSDAGGVLVSAETVDALADAAEVLLLQYESSDAASTLSRAIDHARGATAAKWLRALSAFDTVPA